MAFVLPRSNTPARHIDGVDRDHNFLNCAANERTERCATHAVPCWTSIELRSMPWSAIKCASWAGLALRSLRRSRKR